MNNNNTMSKGYYVFEHIFWSAIAMIWYRNLLFRSIGGMSYSSSRTVLWSVLLVAVVLGVLISWKRRRNNLSLFVNVATPFEIYTLITYAHNFSAIVWIATFIAVLLSGLYTFLLLTQQIKNRTRKRAIIKKRILRASLGSRTIIACCFLSLILCLGVNAVFGGFIFSPSVAAENKNAQEEITTANNIDMISQLDENAWSSLSTEEKLNTLQTVANIEAYYLGLPHELNVTLGSLSESTLACYDDRTHMITLNIDHFDSDSASEVLDSVCHEAFHAYQHRLCDVYDNTDDEYKGLMTFYDIQHYKQEFSNYVNGKDNALEYYFQWCEIDARAYARDAVADYHTKINSYLEKEEP